MSKKLDYDEVYATWKRAAQRLKKAKQLMVSNCKHRKGERWGKNRKYVCKHKGTEVAICSKANRHLCPVLLVLED